MPCSSICLTKTNSFEQQGQQPWKRWNSATHSTWKEWPYPEHPGMFSMPHSDGWKWPGNNATKLPCSGNRPSLPSTTQAESPFWTRKKITSLNHKLQLSPWLQVQHVCTDHWGRWKKMSASDKLTFALTYPGWTWSVFKLSEAPNLRSGEQRDRTLSWKCLLFYVSLSVWGCQIWELHFVPSTF